jgi:hypothetical protein
MPSRYVGVEFLDVQFEITFFTALPNFSLYFGNYQLRRTVGIQAVDFCV